MNGLDPLAQLRDIHLPEPVSWWPPALGWWLAGLLAGGLLIAVGRGTFRYFKDNRYRKAALGELGKLKKERQRFTHRETLEKLSVLLKQVAIQSCGRRQVASLVGKEWLQFLDNTGRTDRFTKGEGRILARGHYLAEVEMIPEELFLLAEKWIRGHKKC